PKHAGQEAIDARGGGPVAIEVDRVKSALATSRKRERGDIGSENFESKIDKMSGNDARAGTEVDDIAAGRKISLHRVGDDFFPSLVPPIWFLQVDRCWFSRLNQAARTHGSP